MVRLYRQQLGITQEELAWRADVHRSYVADIERGGRNITLRRIASLAEALQIPVECLLREHPEEVDRAGTRGGTVAEIVLVEDDPSDAALALRAFDRARFSNPIKVIQDGAEAMDYLLGNGRAARGRRRVAPQLVLLDLNLPKISGLEVLRRIKGHPATSMIPVVMLTGSRHDRDIIECGRLGAENYIIKPLNFETLTRATPALSFRWTLVKPPAR